MSDDYSKLFQLCLDDLERSREDEKVTEDSGIVAKLNAPIVWKELFKPKRTDAKAGKG